MFEHLPTPAGFLAAAAGRRCSSPPSLLRKTTTVPLPSGLNPIKATAWPTASHGIYRRRIRRKRRR